MKPKIICLTPIKNEAWCLDVFLRCTSIWADYIIIADQKSTDGSIEIAKKYSKVILIDNCQTEYDESNRQKLLINRAREIEGDKILVALDADEIFTGGFETTNDWNRILNSSPGEVFGFQWANICPNKKFYFSSSFFYPWVMHDDGVTPHENYTKEMHSMRIPFPNTANYGWYHIKDFKVFHLAYIYVERLKSKRRYYQCLEKVKGIKTHPVSAFRSYNNQKEIYEEIPSSWISTLDQQNIKIFDDLSTSDNFFWFDREVVELIDIYGLKYFQSLHIWDKKWLRNISQFDDKIRDPRNFIQKAMYFYLKSSQKYYPAFLLRAIDKLIKFA